MTVRSILDAKGRDVVTIRPQESLADAVMLLDRHHIGAVVVMEPDGRVAGILSERDVVRALAESGATALQRSVSDTMTSRVSICTEAKTVEEVMEIMTRSRFRHLPVERDGRLVGIISIGDVVKRRIEDAVRETEEIKTYIATA
jgi:CBS domain-containing protein